MPLSSGDKLGPYEILARIGAGGMGEVYRARDTKLDREVAIKVLPAAFAQHPDRLARFEREAKVLASLNHPNIATIYAVEESSEGKALVVELVQGKTLQGPLPVDTALKYAAQIASAVDAAHEKGITHRDLKPANIMLTPDGTIKLLDFGLAAVTQPAHGEGEIGSNMVTLAISPTQSGIILGTAPYMSPEQAIGKPVDRRADIWAFGVVLWELLTGKRLFDGETISHSLASVLKDEPDWEQVPAKLRRLLRSCLEKDVKQRLQAIGDWRLLLDENTAPSPSRLGTSVLWPAVATTVAGVLAISLVGVSWIAWRATRPVARPLMRLSVDLGADAVTGALTAALSPDGTRIVFPIRRRGGLTQLATRLLDQPDATPITGTEGSPLPFFSPDGQWIGFGAGGKLKKVAAQGGVPVTLCDAPNMAGGSWGEDGNIVFASATTGLMRVSDAGGEPQPLTKILDSGELLHVWPQLFPGGAAVLFSARSAGAQSGEDDDIEVLSLRTGQKRVLLHGGYFAHYLPTSNGSGHLVYLHEGTLFGVAFDSDRLEVQGTPAPLLVDIAADARNDSGQFAFSQTGTLVYLSGKASTPEYAIVLLDSGGKTTPLVAQPGVYDSPRFSPDGKRLAYLADAGKGADVFIYDLASDTSTQLTFTEPGAAELAWAPDKEHLVFGASDKNGSALWWIRADRSGEPQRLLEGKIGMRPQSISPDGRRLAFVQDPKGNPDIWMLPLNLDDPEHPKAGNSEVYLASPLVEVDAAFSPNGRWLAYSSNEASTQEEIYVRPSAADVGGKWKISTQGGRFPAWSQDGRLFFLGGDDRIMVTDYTAKGDAFMFSTARVWSKTQILRRRTRQNFDLAPDGKRVAAFPRPDVEENVGTLHVTFLLNFFDEVRRRVPPAK